MTTKLCYVTVGLIALLSACVDNNKKEETELVDSTETATTQNQSVEVKQSSPVSTAPLSQSAGNASSNSQQAVYIVPNHQVTPEELKSTAEQKDEKKNKEDSKQDPPMTE